MTNQGPEGEERHDQEWLAEQFRQLIAVGRENFPRFWEQALSSHIPPRLYELANRVVEETLRKFDLDSLSWRHVAQTLFEHDFINEHLARYVVYYGNTISFVKRFQETISDRFSQIPLTDITARLETDPAVPKNLLFKAYRFCSGPAPFEEMAALGMTSLSNSTFPTPRELAEARTFLESYFAVPTNSQRVTNLLRNS